MSKMNWLKDRVQHLKALYRDRNLAADGKVLLTHETVYDRMGKQWKVIKVCASGPDGPSPRYVKCMSWENGFPVTRVFHVKQLVHSMAETGRISTPLFL